jgi:hypothetical protein
VPQQNIIKTVLITTISTSLQAELVVEGHLAEGHYLFEK